MNRRTGTSGELEDVRREIDAVDDAMLDLLKRRFRAVERVKAIKGLDAGAQGPAFRPAREAQIIRRLVRAAENAVPAGTVAKIWFELIAAATRLQAPLRLHLVVTLRRAQHQDLIRYHGGPDVEIVSHVRPEDALRAVAGSAADMALWPIDDGSGATAYMERRFLAAMLAPGGAELRINARLPFMADALRASAYVVGKAPYEPSGDDTTMIAVASSDEDAAALVAGAGFDRTAAVLRGDAGWSLVAVAGFVAADDERFGRLEADAAVADWRYLGGFANPITVGDTS
ncbi:MAG: chorismate mutase [Hyphomicrobiales bacterium]